MCGIPTKQCLMKTRVPAASNHSLGTESKHINLYEGDIDPTQSRPLSDGQLGKMASVRTWKFHWKFRGIHSKHLHEAAKSRSVVKPLGKGLHEASIFRARNMSLEAFAPVTVVLQTQYRSSLPYMHCNGVKVIKRDHITRVNDFLKLCFVQKAFKHCALILWRKSLKKNI